MRDHARVGGLNFTCARGCESLCFFHGSLFGHRNWGLEILINDTIKKWITLLEAPPLYSHAHTHTQMFLCIIGGIVFPPPPGDCWESFLAREHTYTTTPKKG